MSTDSKKSPNKLIALEFKTSTFSVPVLMLLTDDLISIEQQLKEKVNQAPDFFKNSPLVLDLQEINKLSSIINISALVGIIRKAGLLTVGLRGGNVAENKKEKKSSPTPESKVDVKADVIITTLITQPIRSGQRIYAEGDLIILSQVSAGAEIIAEGNIHVYNTLRGRALAGVQGNEDARIFCFDLQAELISIAGNYKVSEDLDKSLRNKPVQIYLQNQALIIKDIVQPH
jgi:septum site-determining protein MinC